MIVRIADTSSVVTKGEASTSVGPVVSSSNRLASSSLMQDVVSTLAGVSPVSTSAPQSSVLSTPSSSLLQSSTLLMSQSFSLSPSPKLTLVSSQPSSSLLPSSFTSSSSSSFTLTSSLSSSFTTTSSAPCKITRASISSSSSISDSLSSTSLTKSSSLSPLLSYMITSQSASSSTSSQMTSSSSHTITPSTLLPTETSLSLGTALYSSLNPTTSLSSTFSSSRLPTRTLQSVLITGIIQRSSSSSSLVPLDSLVSSTNTAHSLNTPKMQTSTSLSSSTTSVQRWSLSTLGVSGAEVTTSGTTSLLGSSTSVVGDTIGINKNIDSFLQNIEKLDVKDVSSLNKSLAMMERLLNSTKPADYSTNQNPLNVSKTLEEFAFRYMDHHWNGTGFYYDRHNIVLQGNKCYPGNDDYKFRVSERESEESAITLPKENFVSNGTLILSIAYKRLDNLMDGQSYKLENDSFRYKLKSMIISTSIKPRRQTLKNNATMVFKIPPKAAVDSGSDKECVFWRFPTEHERDAGWSRDGCIVTTTTDEHVKCSCNHLTHFAVLMQVNDDQLSRNEDAILMIITKSGLSLSIVGCVITFFCYWFFTEVKSEQSQIRMNLVFVLAVAHILFLLGNPARFHLVVCVVVAVLLQLFYTSALCWMFAEGIQLYMQVIKVFNTNLKMRQVYGFAWGFPLLLITVSLSIAGNGSGGLSSFVNDDFCWLSVQNHLIWTFIAPVILLILSNLVVLGMVLKEMNRINPPTGDKHAEISLRSSVKALIVLAPLLGVTWLTGLLCILGADVIGLYIFTILNSIQGFLIFVFHCWRNSEIQGKFRRKIQALEENRSKQDDIFHVQNYRHREHVKKEAFTKMPTVSKRPKARKQSPGGLTISDFDPSDFMEVEFNACTKL